MNKNKLKFILIHAICLYFLPRVGDIVGVGVLKHFQKFFPKQWLNIEAKLESAKTCLGPSNMRLSCPLPATFDTEMKNHCGKGFPELVKQYNNTNVTFTEGFLTIKPGKMEEIFDNVIDNIISHARKKVLGNQKALLGGKKYLFIVGGFGSNKYFQRAVINAFSDSMTVFFPREPQLAVIRGAVILGYQPKVVQSRIARFTYGCQGNIDFINGKHDIGRLKVRPDGKRKCVRCFKAFVRSGEEVPFGLIKTVSFTNCSRQNTRIKILRSSDPSPLYSDEEGVQEVGALMVKNQAKLTGRAFKMVVTFSGAEILVDTREVMLKTGNSSQSLASASGVFEFSSMDLGKLKNSG